MNHRITMIYNKDLKKGVFENVQFIFIAGSGAMGSGGDVMVVTSGGSIFQENYCMGDIKLNKLYRAIPVLKDFVNDPLGDDSKIPDGWKYEYLGFGNCLLIRDDIYLDFKRELKGAEENDIYPIWLDVACNLINGRNKERSPFSTKNLDKIKTYKSFVKKIQQNYKNKSNESIQFKTCDVWKSGDQINLWTYWQGYQIKNIESGVDIMLVGQDWGNPDRQLDVVERIKQFQNGNGEVGYAATSSNPTDRALIKLFNEIGIDIAKENPGCRLFFTNYFLGYRAGNEAGGMTKSLLLKDRKYFDELIGIIKPRNIICLGKLVYEAVTGKNVNDFVNQLKKGAPLVSTYPLDNDIMVFGVPHCGARGSNNIGGYDRMKDIWKEMKKQIEGNY